MEVGTHDQQTGSEASKLLRYCDHPSPMEIKLSYGWEDTHSTPRTEVQSSSGFTNNRGTGQINQSSFC